MSRSITISWKAGRRIRNLTILRELNHRSNGCLCSCRNLSLFNTRKSNIKFNFARGLSSKSEDSEILGKSSLLYQDGIDIHELPLVVRKLYAHEVPLISANYQGDHFHSSTQQELEFTQQLQNCENVYQVMKLLEVPEEQVSGYSAIFALSRLNDLQKNHFSVDSFLHKAIFNELFETALSGLNQQENSTLIALMKCCIHSNLYPEPFLKKVEQEIERRIGDNKFSIQDACLLIKIMAYSLKRNVSLIESLAIHVSNRSSEIQAEDVVSVHKIAKILPKHIRETFLPVINRQVLKLFSDLETDAIVACTETMSFGRSGNDELLELVFKWMTINFHKLNDSTMTSIVTAFRARKFKNDMAIELFERYVSLKIFKMDRVLLCLMMDYFLLCRHLSKPVLDAVARDFEHNGHLYKPIEIFLALRPFGLLNYLPDGSLGLFEKIEDVLRDKYDEFPPYQILELLTTFAYLKRMPINFYNSVFSPYFVSKLRSLNGEELSRSRRNFRLLFTALIRDHSPHTRFSYISLGFGYKPRPPPYSNWRTFHDQIANTLFIIAGKNFYMKSQLLESTPYFVDFLVHLDKLGNFLPIELGEEAMKVVILTIFPEDMVCNTKNLMGEMATKVRHIKSMGYSIIQVNYEEFMWECKTDQEQRNFMINKFQKLMKSYTNKYYKT